MGVKLGEKALDGDFTQGEHEGLVAVIATAEVAVAKGVGHGDLGRFFAIAEDAEFGTAAQHLAPPNQAGLPAPKGGAVIVHHLLGGNDVG